MPDICLKKSSGCFFFMEAFQVRPKKGVFWRHSKCGGKNQTNWAAFRVSVRRYIGKSTMFFQKSFANSGKLWKMALLSKKKNICKGSVAQSPLYQLWNEHEIICKWPFSSILQSILQSILSMCNPFSNHQPYNLKSSFYNIKLCIAGLSNQQFTVWSTKSLRTGKFVPQFRETHGRQLQFQRPARPTASNPAGLLPGQLIILFKD